MATLAGLRTELTAFAGSFDAAGLLTSEAEAVVRDATAIVNLASTVRMFAAKRVADSASWKHRGHRTPAEWLAKETKSSVGEAIGALEAAEKIVDCPQVEAAARAGGLSGEQTKVLAKAVAADPVAEDRLLGVAERDGLKKLKETCREVELASRGDTQARYDKIHRERSMRHWTDDDGSFRMSAKLTPDAGAKILGALAPFEKAAFDRARTDGRHEPHEAYRADALVGLAEASLADDSTDGDESSAETEKAKTPRTRKPSFTVLVDIRAYCSATRHIPTMLRVALEARDRECVVPGCNQTQGLEIDHVHPFGQRGPTTYENLALLSHHHHRLKTLEGWTLTHQQGQWHFDPPDKTGTDPP